MSARMKPRDPLVALMDQVRLRRGMEASTWAELAGVSRQTVYRAINGHRSISYEMMKKLAAALGLKLVLKPLDN